MIPIILLAFANDKRGSGAGYLRGLTTERNAIRDALMKAEENGLCQVLVEPDATVDRIFDIFQNSNYRDRIALFHYGGHAESYSLLLETASGEKATAHSEGLVGFLAKQKSLKLVFLNGCSSQKQSEELVAAGLPAVIGTSQSIDDTIATGLATRFYKGLSSGMAIERAWTEAVDQIKTEKGTANTKVFFYEGILGSPGENQFPWELYTGEGGALSKAWNLPEAANQPLFGLELPKSYYRKLPVAPYVGLRSYKREEAAIFFGRGPDIRKLYTQLEREQPVILVSGKKGVGKSSLLAAGLAPRLETKYAVSCYTIEGKGLADSLNEALDQVREAHGMERLAPKDKSNLEGKIAEVQKLIPTIHGFAKEILEKELQRLVYLAGMERQTYYDQWMHIEEKTGLPLIVLLDELPADPAEWKVFYEIVVSIFETNKGPRGKLVLSVDEENYGPFCELLQSAGFPYADLFLQPLNWDGIEEAIAGVTLSPITKEFYRLEIENTNANNLPATLRGDLTDGDPTLVAPFLQVILSDLWTAAIEENARAPSFTMKSYQEGMQSGEIMERFLSHQLARIEEWNEEPVQTGLALDLLYLHTSALGKSNILEAPERMQTYEDRQEMIDGLIRKCKDIFLLTGIHADDTILGHNLLAHVVIRHYSISLNPGQQAARILNGKTGDTAESGKASWLNERDLDTVEKGLKGMRCLRSEEKDLLEYSRAKKIQAQKERKRNKIIRAALVSVVAIFAVLAVYNWLDARQKYLMARAGELAFNAKEVFKKDNTLAFNIARQAYSILNSDSPPEVMQTLSEIFHSQEVIPFYVSKFPHSERVNTAVFAPEPDANYVLTASEDGTAKLWDLNGNLIQPYQHPKEVKMAAFSPTGQQILTLTIDHVYLWERNKGTPTDTDSFPPETITTLEAFSTDGIKIIPNHIQKDSNTYNLLVDSLRLGIDTVITSLAENRILIIRGGFCSLLDKKGKMLKDSFVSSVDQASFSRKGEKMMTISWKSELAHIIVWDEKGDSLYSFKGKGDKVDAVFSPDGKSILATLNDYTLTANSFSAKLWDLSETFLHQFHNNSQAMNTVDFYPEKNIYLTASPDGNVVIWDTKGEPLDTLEHKAAVISAFFSPDGKHIITASHDTTARIWTPTEPKEIVLMHRGELRSAVFSHNGQHVLTSSTDSLVRLWSLKGQPVDTFLHPNGNVSNAEFSIDDLHILSISDNAATLWDINGDSLHVFKHREKVNSARFSPDGKRLLTSCSDNFARLWNSDGTLVDSFPHTFDVLRHAFFTEDDHHIITGGTTVKIWNATSMALEDTLSHSGSVSWIAVSPDGRMILTTCNDHNAYLWNFKRELLAIYKKHTGPIYRGLFTPDGSHVLTAANDGYIIRWKTPPAIFAELKTSRIAQLTSHEEEQYGIDRWDSPMVIFSRLKTAMIDFLSPKEKDK